MVIIVAIFCTLVQFVYEYVSAGQTNHPLQACKELLLK